MLLLLSVLIYLELGVAQVKKPDVDTRVENLLKQMTLEEKIGQMTQVTIHVATKKVGTVDQKYEWDPLKLEEAIVTYHVGSLLNVHDKALSVEEWHKLITAIQDIATKKTRLKIPIIYGIDAIHGVNYTKGATLFPQSIAMAATRNPDLVRKEGEITAYEVRASGISWNFNPVLDLGRNPLWPRLWEGYGEDPYLSGVMAYQYVKGSEGENNDISNPTKVAACMKHYLGYSFPLSGKDRTPAWIPERMLREYFLVPFAEAARAGVHTVMINSSEINGIPVHSDPVILKDILYQELGFKGFTVSDWYDIMNLYEREKVAASPKEAVKMAVMAGVDMSMVPYNYSFYNDLLALVNEKEVPVERINEAVRRILKVKYELGLFEKPYPDKNLLKKFGSKEFVNISLQAAREAMTLLKNEKNFLPLDRNQKILISGPTANLLSCLNGGWTYTWQGNEERLYPREKKTILEAVTDKIGSANVEYIPGVEYDREIDIPAAVAAAKKCKLAILCLGEMPYCESMGNIDDLNLPEAQIRLAGAIKEAGIPYVLVLVEGRPRLINRIADDAAAIIMAYLPGLEGGVALADVLFGDFNPCGKLPITYPRHPNDLLCYDYKYSEVAPPNRYDPQFPFGHGLSYTTFLYSDLMLDKKEGLLNEPLEVQVTVTNTGKIAGREVVQVYLSDLVRSVTPPVKQLKWFTGINLNPGESRTIAFTLSAKDLSFIGRENKRIVEPGEFLISVEQLQAKFNLLAE